MTSSLARGVRELVEKVSKHQIHPGLRLDKYVETPTKQAEQRDSIEKAGLTAAFQDPGLLDEMRRRKRLALDGLNATIWVRKTTESVVLHLARASSLENASTCLHPVYGFSYLPGTGLKGMARAHAETIWKPAQTDSEWADARIRAVFGSAEKLREVAGGVVFHEAWPTKWPRLVLDITNSHHPKYYQGEDDPGDWEAPVPVTFLAVKPGVQFEFALSLRGGENRRELIELAKEWLDGALTHLGAGGKTAAGYGRFATEGGIPAKLETPSRLQREYTLTLTTPGFFAGAEQNKPESCRLRGATLRGMLRWWWRTMHAGHLRKEELLLLEKLIWGGTAGEDGNDHGSAVSVSLQPERIQEPIQYNKFETADSRGLKKPDQSGGKATLGMFYFSYGMHEKSRGVEKKRHYLGRGSAWRVRLTARDAKSGQKIALTRQEVMDQAVCAVWLLCHLGGIGSKGRKGFGCLSLGEAKDAAPNIQQIRHRAADLRAKLGMGRGFEKERSMPGSLDLILGARGKTGPLELALGTADEWQAIERLGSSVQAFAASHHHRKEKLALGLPRNIHREPKEWLRCAKGDRYAAPVHYHLFERDGTYCVRVTAFPAPYLPNVPDSTVFLTKLLEHLLDDIPRRAMEPPPSVRTPLPRPQPTDGERSQVGREALRVGDEVRGQLLEERTRKGGWRAEVSGMRGVIQNSGKVPVSAKPGDSVKLRVKIAKPTDPAFEYLPD
jgi:CRISPR-associated protein Cmr6